MSATNGIHRGIDVQDSYLGATTTELQQVTWTRRVLAVANQAVLFPHRGEIVLTEGQLTLGTWRTISGGALVRVTREFLPEYNRFTAGGARGGFPSLGVLKRAGAPLVLDLASGERLVLLVGFEALSGVTKNKEWFSALRGFSTLPPREV